MAKFASITAELLARKGEARPWSYNSANESTPVAEPVLPLHREPAADLAPVKAAEPHPHAAHPSLEGGRKLTLRLSEPDYECLGLIATKRDVTRQALLRELLDHFLAEAALEHRGQCGCIGKSCRR